MNEETISLLIVSTAAVLVALIIAAACVVKHISNNKKQMYVLESKNKSIVALSGYWGNLIEKVPCKNASELKSVIEACTGELLAIFSPTESGK